MLSVVSAGDTHRGRVRSENQDRFLTDDRLRLFIVADGMGGMEDGAGAAAFVVKELGRRLLALETNGFGTTAERLGSLTRTVEGLSHALWQETAGQGGSTLVLARVLADRVLVANAGDSPAYLFHSQQLQALTCEHNVAGFLVQQGKITAQEALRHPLQHQLVSYVGMKRGIMVHTQENNLQPGDRLLLASDGLGSMLEEATIAKILAQFRFPAAAVKQLIQEAITAGGEDNITAVVVDIL